MIGFSERTYDAAKVRPPSARDRSDVVAKVEIRRVFDDNSQCYGGPADSTSSGAGKAIRSHGARRAAHALSGDPGCPAR